MKIELTNEEFAELLAGRSIVTYVSRSPTWDEMSDHSHADAAYSSVNEAVVIEPPRSVV